MTWDDESMNSVCAILVGQFALHVGIVHDEHDIYEVYAESEAVEPSGRIFFDLILGFLLGIDKDHECCQQLY